MAKLYDTLLAPEWRTVIHPRNLADAVLQGFRMLSSRISGIIRGDLAHNTTRSLYRTLTIPLDDIIYVNAPCVAGDDVKAVADNPVKANARISTTEADYPHRCVKYRFKTSLADIDIFGADGVHKEAIRGRDFYYNDGYYWFDEHPSAFGSVGSVDKKTVVSFVVVGGAKNTDFDPLGIGFHGTTNQATRDAIWTALYGNAPIGLTNTLIYATGGCKLSKSVIRQHWTECGFNMALTVDGELLWAPVGSGVAFVAGQPVDLSSIVGSYQYFGVKTPQGAYILGPGLYKAADYPGIMETFPELGTIDGINFSGAELFRLLTQRGCTFICWQYIKSDGGSAEALSQYATTGKVAISTKTEASENTLSFTTAGSGATGGTVNNTLTLSTTGLCYNHS